MNEDDLRDQFLMVTRGVSEDEHLRVREALEVQKTLRP